MGRDVEPGMRGLARAAVLLSATPFAILSLPGGRVVQLAVLPLAAVLMLSVSPTRPYSTQSQSIRRSFRWVMPLGAFLILGLVGIAVSPYRAEAASKGLIQIAGMLVVVGGALGTARWFGNHPAELRFAIRWIVRLIGVLIIVGLLQWCTYNILDRPQSLNLDWFHGLLGETSHWQHPGQVGSWYRINSLAREPAHLARYLGGVSGLAMIRLGLFGRRPQRSVSMLVPRWFAWSALLALLLSGSVVALLIAVVCPLLVYVYSRRIDPRRLVQMAVVCCLAIAVVLGAGLQLGQQSKLETVTAAFRPFESASQYDGTYISALALNANRIVTVANLESYPLVGVGLGGHSSAYAAEFPLLGPSSPFVLDLNVEDAASLVLRLLSETGIVGTLLHMTAMLMLVASLRRRTVIKPSTEAGATHRWVAIGLAAGMTATLVGDYARFGQYYDVWLWILVALSIAAASVFADSATEASHSSADSGPRLTRASEHRLLRD